jgi:glycosyltransferase involved in cell wall biosynthesis
MMKVAYFALGETYNSSHAGFVHTYNIVKALSKYVQIRLFIRGTHQKTDIPATFVSLPSITIENPVKYMKSYINLKSELKKFDLIHERFHINPVDLFFVKSKKYILEVNDPAPIIYSGLKKRLYSKIIQRKFNRADAIITQTNTLKKILSKFYSGEIHVVPNGLDVKFFEKNMYQFDIRKKYGISKEQLVITFIGSFREWHGVQNIPSMAEEIGKDYEDAVFLLVGSGPLFEKVQGKGIKNIILTGSLPYDNIPSILAQSDILIAPFNTKRFISLEKYGFYWCPVKLFEYMYSGKPIVSYDYEEIKNITKGAALFAKPGDVHDFIKNIRKLIDDKNLRKKLGNQGKRIAKNYDWTNRAKEILKIYREIL